MRVEDRIKAINSYVSSSFRGLSAGFRNYPQEILELIVFHKLHFHMPHKVALQTFRRLKTNFVDWNEARVSSIKEIQHVFDGVEDSLELAIFLKDFLEQLQRENQSMSLEFLADQNMVEIRRYLRGIKGVNNATINLILRIRREYPVLPVSVSMERTLLRLGVVRPGDKRDQKERYLHNLIGEEQALPFHHFLLQHSLEICPPEDENLQCMSCGIRGSCSFFQRNKRKLNGSSVRGKKNTKGNGSSTAKARKGKAKSSSRR